MEARGNHQPMKNSSVTLIVVFLHTHKKYDVAMSSGYQVNKIPIKTRTAVRIFLDCMKVKWRIMSYLTKVIE